MPESARGAERPLRVIQVGTGGMGRYWCHTVWPHVVRLGKAEVVAAVDVVQVFLADHVRSAQK